jgi:small subunit ribosomal protein S8
MTDPIADMLTRIRNAHAIHAKTVVIPHSRVKEAMVAVMKTENYVTDYQVEASVPKNIIVTLKYIQGKPAITNLKRVSKPGRRLYSPAKSIPKTLGGYGMSIITTSLGIMSDKQAKATNAGGEILCEIY